MKNTLNQPCAVRMSLETVMDAHPTLSDTGFLTRWNSDSRSREEFQVKLEEGRKSLRKAIDSYRHTCIWLSDIKTVQKVNPKAHSYRLKHLAENRACYVSNGAFIAAALHCGLKMKRCEDQSPNAWFNISSRCINERNPHNL